MSKKKDKKKVNWVAGEPVNDGEFYEITHVLWETCCDCRLRHHTLFFRKDKKGNFVPNEEPLYVLNYRDEAVTVQLRNEDGIKLTKKKG